MIRKEVIIHEIENGCVVSFYPLTDEETGDVLSLEYIFKTRVELLKGLENFFNDIDPLKSIRKR
jgi:hypothetical protein